MKKIWAPERYSSFPSNHSYPVPLELKIKTTLPLESEVIAVADYIPELETLLRNALMTATDLSGQAEWIDVCTIEGDAYAFIPDGPVDTKRVPIHFAYDITTGQITYQL